MLECEGFRWPSKPTALRSVGRHDSWTTPFLLEPFSHEPALFSDQEKYRMACVETALPKLLAGYLLGSLR